MPTETKEALNSVLGTTFINDWGFEVSINKETRSELVNAVRDHFNKNDINYETFDYNDLKEFF